MPNGRGINHPNAILAFAQSLSDEEVQVAIFLRYYLRLNTDGQIEFIKYMISLYKNPMGHVKETVTLNECQTIIDELGRQIEDLQRRKEEVKVG